jgi:hypothetical protein
LHLAHPHLQPGGAVLRSPLLWQLNIQPLAPGILLHIGVYLIEGNLQRQGPAQ